MAVHVSVSRGIPAVILLAVALSAQQAVADPVTATNRASVIDSDDPKFQFVREATVEPPEYSYPNPLAISADERDEVFPGTNGVEGGAYGRVKLDHDDSSDFSGYPSIIMIDQTSAGIINAGALSSHLSGNGVIQTPAVVLTVNEPFQAYGGGVALYVQTGVHSEWGYFKRWLIDGTIIIQTFDQNDNPLPSQSFAFQGATEQQVNAHLRSDTAFPNDILEEHPHFRGDFADAARGEARINLDVESYIVDGQMPPQGDKPIEEWPRLNTDSYFEFSMIPTRIGTKYSPIRPQTKSIPDFTTFFNGRYDIVRQAMAMDFEWCRHGCRSFGWSPPAPEAAEGSVIPVRQVDLIGKLAFLPTDHYYAVPDPTASIQIFGIGFGDLFTSIDDFASFSGPVRVIAEGQDLGLFGEGDRLDFVAVLGHGVKSFDLWPQVPGQLDMEPPPSLKLSFDAPVGFMLIAVPIPEPSTGAISLFAAILLLCRCAVRRGATAG